MTNDTSTSTSNEIIALTPSAIKEVKRLIAQDDQTGLYLRLGVTSGGCSGMSYSMSFDADKSEFDREFEFDGVKVLVDLKALPHLAGSTIEFHSGLMGSGFEFKNPQAKRSCGCGSSFSC